MDNVCSSDKPVQLRSVVEGRGPGFFEQWREEFARHVSRIEASTLDQDKFVFKTQVLSLPDFTVASNFGAHCALMRTASLLKDGNDSFHLSLCVGGRCEFRFGGDVAALTPGCATLFSSARIGGCVVDTSLNSLHLRFSRETGRAICPAIEHHYMRVLDTRDAGLRVLISYLQALFSMKDGLPQSVISLANNQILEILAHIFNPGCDLSLAAPYGGVKAARLRSILDHIAKLVADPSLSITRVAADLGLSVRYVQQLFEGVGMSFSDYLCKLRLNNAKRMLGDARHAHLRIIEISSLAGFNDLSHFNRRYRAHFGVTPKESRVPNGNCPAADTNSVFHAGDELAEPAAHSTFVRATH